MVQALSPEKCERIRRLCATYSGHDVIRIAKISSSTLYALKKRDFRPMQIGRQRQPRPADFTLFMNHMTKPQLARYYGVGEPTVREWLIGLDRTYRPERARDRPERDVVLRALIQAGALPGAAALLGVGMSTLRKWRKHYDLPNARTLQFWSQSSRGRRQITALLTPSPERLAA